MKELEKEAEIVASLIDKAFIVLNSGEDKKWNELRDVLRADEFRGELPRQVLSLRNTKTLSVMFDRIRQELGQHEAVVEIHGGIKREERRRIKIRSEPIHGSEYL